MGKNPDDLKTISAAESEVDELRARTEELLGELERRIEGRVDTAKQRVEDARQKLSQVKRAVDLPRHARAHPRAATGIGLGTAVAIGLCVWLLVARRSERNRWQNRTRRRAIAYRALLANPERALAQRDAPLPRKLIGALVVTIATTLARRFLSAGVGRALPPRQMEPAPAL